MKSSQKIFNVVVIVAISMVSVIVYYIKNSICSYNESSSWPKTIHVTYRDKRSIPIETINRLRDMNPEYTIKTYGDTECEKFLDHHWGQEYGDLFRSIPDGPIKSDLWRGCVLHTYGGVYLDIYVKLLKPISDVFSFDIDFGTSGSWDEERVNPIIIVSRPESRILLQCARRMLAHHSKSYSYWGYSICPTLFQVLRDEIGVSFSNNKEGFYRSKRNELIQLLSEKKGDGEPKTMWKGKIVLLNHGSRFY